jgi:hypothetical protein
MKAKFNFFLLGILYSMNLYSQPSIQWQESLGGSLDDAAYSIQTIDGGYVFAGAALSTDGNIPGSNGSYDFWIVKMDESGTIIWNKNYGGSQSDIAQSITQTNDGGYIVAGYSNSNDSDVSGNHGVIDCWIIKLDISGSLTWQKTFGGSRIEEAKSIKQTYDGGYIAVGYSLSNDGDITNHHGSVDTSDIWVLKLDFSGNIEWEKSFGGTNNESATGIYQTIDSGYVICGSSFSNDGDVSVNHGADDFWIIKIDYNGSIQWQKSYGGSGFDEANSIQQTMEGDYIICGSSSSNDGDVTGNHGYGDYWIIRLDNSGNLKWQKSYGGSDGENSFSIRQTIDSGFIIGGLSRSLDGDVTGNHGNLHSDFWIVKIDSIGNLQWQKSIGGSMHDTPFSIWETVDGGCIISGYSMSSNGDATFNHGDYDAWIVKLNPFGSVDINEIQKSILDFQISPNPFSIFTTFSFKNLPSDKFKLQITDIEGRIIKYIDSGELLINDNLISWNATDNFGNKINNGIYFVRLLTEGKCLVKKVIAIGN